MTAPATPSNLVVQNNLDTNNAFRYASVTLTWDANTESDIDHYNIYRNYVPYGTFKKIGTATGVTFIDQLTFNSQSSESSMDQGISIAIDGYWYYRITAVNTSNEESELTIATSYFEYQAYNTNPFSDPMSVGGEDILYGDDDAADYPDNEDLAYYFSALRSRRVWQLHNMGQKVILFKRRKEGTKCPLWETDAESCPHPLGEKEDLIDACYGTGFLGGYYEPFIIKVRLVSEQSKISIDKNGMIVKNALS